MTKTSPPFQLPKCSRCKVTARPLDKFCPSCGRRIGFGLRSENEIRAAIAKLDATTFTVSDMNMKAMIMSDIILYKDTLAWVLGEKSEDPIEMIVADIKNNGKVRHINDKGG